MAVVVLVPLRGQGVACPAPPRQHRRFLQALPSSILLARHRPSGLVLVAQAWAVPGLAAAVVAALVVLYVATLGRLVGTSLPRCHCPRPHPTS